VRSTDFGRQTGSASGVPTTTIFSLASLASITQCAWRISWNLKMRDRRQGHSQCSEAGHLRAENPGLQPVSRRVILPGLAVEDVQAVDV
jgi:hypothetical protein